MSIFVTQSVESSVTVLVFARPSPVTEVLQTALQKKQLEVLVVDPLSLSEDKLNKLQSQQFYKICWVFDDTVKGTAQADLIFQFLFAREEPLTVLMATLSQNTSLPEWEEKRVGDDQLLQHFKKYLPFSQVFVVSNWIDQPEFFISPLFFFKTEKEITEFHKGVETKKIISVLVESLLRPHRSRVEKIEGTESFSPEIIESWKKEQKAKNPPKNKEKSPPGEEAIKFIPPKPKKPREPTIESEGFELHSKYEEVQVIPFGSPKILNRQKLYEENISKIKHRYKKQRLLRPVSRYEAAPSLHTSREHQSLEPYEQHLELTIQHMFGSHRTEQREVRYQNKALKTVKTRRKQERQKRVMRVVVVSAVLLFISSGLVGSFFGLRSILFNTIVSQDNSQNLSDHQVWQSPWTKVLLDVLATETQAYQAVMGQDSLPETAAVVSAARQMQTIHLQRRQLEELMQKAASQVIGKTPGNAFETVSELELQQQTLYSTLSVIQTQLQSISTEFLEEKETQAIDKILTEIQQTRRQVATFEQVRQLLPALLGQDGKRRIAVIIEDSQELRPSGGVILGVYLVTLEKGVIIDQQFYDAVQIQDLNKGEVVAPKDYQKYLNQTDLLLTDAGWGPDFTQTSVIVNNYLDKNLGRKADFLLGVTTNSLQELLEKTGSVQLSQTGEVITDKNLFERLEFNPENEYLKTVFVDVFKKILSDPTQTLQALSVIASDFQSGQAFLVSAQPTENDVLNSLGWAGQVSTPQCPSQLNTDKCQISTIYQVESNVGLNKVGPLIERETQHTIRVEKSATLHQRAITLTNKATTTRWPSGLYRSYMRFYLPSDVEIKGVRVGGKPIDLNALDVEELPNSKMIGFLVEVPIQTTVPILLEYQQPFVYSSGVGLAFFDQKQAGTAQDQYTLTVISEDGIQPGVIAPKALVQANKIVFQQPREKHQFAGIRFR